MSHITLIYPRWPKLTQQTEFHLPPHAPVCVAAEIPEHYKVTFIDEHVDVLDADIMAKTDVALISIMLTCQVSRGIEIADDFRGRGIKVILGGIAAMLHAEEVASHVDALFLGEVEDGRLARVLQDWENGKLKPIYDYMHNFPPIACVGPARRSILNKPKYTYRGVQMVDLIHASRGCRFNCYPCSVHYLGGKNFRPRPLNRVVEEIQGIDNKRLFFVDNSLAQDKAWLLDLFEHLKPLNISWVSHPVLDDDDVLASAAEAGCWYVYQAIFDTSDYIRNRIKRMKEHGIGIEAAVILGMDHQTMDSIRALVDFLLEIEIDMAEFSILTPFHGTPATIQYEKEGRILHKDWRKYNTGSVCFQPRNMTPDQLQEMYHYAWATFYKEMPSRSRMARLFERLRTRELDVLKREKRTNVKE